MLGELIYSTFRKHAHNLQVNMLNLCLQPIDEQLKKLEHFDKRSKLETLDVLKEIKAKIGFYSLFYLIERNNVRDIEYEESMKRMHKIADRLNDFDQRFKEQERQNRSYATS